MAPSLQSDLRVTESLRSIFGLANVDSDSPFETIDQPPMSKRLPLPELTIEGFRTFKHLNIRRLGRVNLIVGDNNVGKTSLLEAIHLYSEIGGIAARIENILIQRDEVDRRSPDKERAVSALDTMRLFHQDHDGNQNFELRIAAQGERRSQDLRIALSLLSRITDGGRRQWVQDDASPQFFEGAEFVDSDVRQRGLLIETTGEIQSIPLSHFGRRRGPVAHEENVRYKCEYVAGGSHPGRFQLSALWDRVVLTPGEQVVLSMLRLIEPSLSRMSLVNPRSGSAERIPFVSVEASPQPVPLRSMGAGMIRILWIALGMVNAANGVLLVDEIDNGIHFSKQREMWKVIFAFAQKLNIQVFATTHSWDCINAFQVAATDDATEGMLVKILKEGDEHATSVFDEDELEILTRQEVEVR